MCSTPEPISHVVHAGGDQGRGEVRRPAGPSRTAGRRWWRASRSAGPPGATRCDRRSTTARRTAARSPRPRPRPRSRRSRRARSPRCSSGRAARWDACPCSNPSPGVRVRSASATASTMTTSRPDCGIRCSLCSGFECRNARMALANRIVITVLKLFLSQPDQTGVDLQERLGIAGSGTIACGLAVAAAEHGEVLLWARSERVRRARPRARRAKTCAKLNGFDARPHPGRDRSRRPRLRPRSSSRRSSSTTARKAAMLADLGELARHAGADAVLATTTSSLSIAELAQASGHPENGSSGCTVQPGAADGAGRACVPAEASAETRRAGSCAVRVARQDPRRGPRHSGLRRQPAAVPVPVQRRRAAWPRRDGPRTTSTAA